MLNWHFLVRRPLKVIETWHNNYIFSSVLCKSLYFFIFYINLYEIVSKGSVFLYSLYLCWLLTLHLCYCKELYKMKKKIGKKKTNLDVNLEYLLLILSRYLVIRKHFIQVLNTCSSKSIIVSFISPGDFIKTKCFQ